MENPGEQENPAFLRHRSKFRDRSTGDQCSSIQEFNSNLKALNFLSLITS